MRHAVWGALLLATLVAPSLPGLTEVSGAANDASLMLPTAPDLVAVPSPAVAAPTPAPLGPTPALPAITSPVAPAPLPASGSAGAIPARQLPMPAGTMTPIVDAAGNASAEADTNAESAATNATSSPEAPSPTPPTNASAPGAAAGRASPPRAPSGAATTPAIAAPIGQQLTPTQLGLVAAALTLASGIAFMFALMRRSQIR